MKTITLLSLLLLLYCSPPTATGQNKREKKAAQTEQAFRQIRQLAESNRFRIETDRAYPQSGRDVSRFNPQGTITITDSIAQGELPYFGRAYHLPYGEGGGIRFNAPMKNQSLRIHEKRKKKTVIYQFSVPAENDFYQLFIEISPGGACTVNVNGNNRAHISYSGEILPLEEN